MAAKKPNRRRREKERSRPLAKRDIEFVELKDDGAALFKTGGPERAKRERAAYLINRFLNLDLVPPTVIRELDGQVGMLQQFIPDAKTASKMGIEKLEADYRDWLKKLWVFDAVIGNTDRNGGNILVKEGRLYAIDHEAASGFYVGSRFVSILIGYRLSYYGNFYDEDLPPDLVENFKRFLDWREGEEKLKDFLTELIGKEAAAAQIQRIKEAGRDIVQNRRVTKPIYQTS